MPQRFGDADFTGNVRCRGRLILDRGIDLSGNPLVEELRQRLAAVGDRKTDAQDYDSVAAVAVVRDELDACASRVGKLHDDLGAIAATVHAHGARLETLHEEVAASVTTTRASKSEVTETLCSELEGIRGELARLGNRQNALEQEGQPERSATATLQNDDLVELRSELSALRSQAPVEGTSSEEMARLSRTVNELLVQAKHRSSDGRHSTTQEAVERLVEHAVSELRSEFTHVQRDSHVSRQCAALSDESSRLQRAVSALETATSDIREELSAMRADLGRDSERYELQRRQVATIVAELDVLKRAVRSQS